MEVARAVTRCWEARRPLLIGTASVNESETVVRVRGGGACSGGGGGVPAQKGWGRGALQAARARSSFGCARRARGPLARGRARALLSRCCGARARARAHVHAHARTCTRTHPPPPPPGRQVLHSLLGERSRPSGPRHTQTHKHTKHIKTPPPPQVLHSLLGEEWGPELGRVQPLNT